MPAARPTSAKVMKKTAVAVTTFRNGATPRKWLDTTVRHSARIMRGTRPVQNFDQRKAFIDTGDVRTTQKAPPSAETAGKMKRTATAERTNPAMARFTKA